jgi:hypothetical protein
MVLPQTIYEQSPKRNQLAMFHFNHYTMRIFHTPPPAAAAAALQSPTASIHGAFLGFYR